MNINVKLVDSTQEIILFAKTAAAAKKDDEQKEIDKNYKNVVLNIDSFVKQLNHIIRKTSFMCSSELIDKTKYLIICSQKLINDDTVTRSNIADLRKRLKELEDQLSEEWETYYLRETKSVEDTLELSKSIAGVNVSSLLNNIKQGRDWKSGPDAIDTMVYNLESAKEIINNLDLQDNVVNFLKKMANRTATVEDLDEGMISWIKKENLSGRIKLSF